MKNLLNSLVKSFCELKKRFCPRHARYDTLHHRCTNVMPFARKTS